MKLSISKSIDLLIYIFLITFVAYDCCICFSKVNNPLVVLSFIPCAIICITGFIRSKGFLSLDQLLFVFTFMFCYYTPLHQFVEGTNIHKLSIFTDSDYMFANSLIILFLSIFLITRLKKTKTASKKSFFNLKVNTSTLFVFFIVSTLCLLWLQANNALFSFGDISERAADESSKIIVTKIIRFIPMAALLVSIYAYKDKNITGQRSLNKVFFVLIALYCSIIFFPINGTLSRYLLFGTYIMIMRALGENFKHKSYILLVSFIGFYLIFPAFNFFKYHTMSDLSDFSLGGFDVSFIDYDAYQMFMQTIKYVSTNDMLYGQNIITSVLCLVPRSIWQSKMIPSGQLIAETYGASFTNLSCPIFAEFYLAFGIAGIIFFTYFFASLINFFEAKNMSNSPCYRAMYSIAAGMLVSFLRGAMLPMTSFWVCLTISLLICYFVCFLCTQKSH